MIGTNPMPSQVREILEPGELGAGEGGGGCFLVLTQFGLAVSYLPLSSFPGFVVVKLPAYPFLHYRTIREFVPCPAHHANGPERCKVPFFASGIMRAPYLAKTLIAFSLSVERFRPRHHQQIRINRHTSLVVCSSNGKNVS